MREGRCGVRAVTARGKGAFYASREEYMAAQRELRARLIEDYLFIGGDRMPARQAAERLGVCERTIVRYRRQLREEGR